MSANWLGCLTKKQERQTNSSGCFGQYPLVALVLVVRVGDLFVLGLVFDDETFFQDHVKAGLDVFVLGLVLIVFVVVALLAGAVR